MENNKIKVLIIEDEKPYLRLLDAFPRSPCRGRSSRLPAPKPSQALELLETGGYDVIISDFSCRQRRPGDLYRHLRPRREYPRDAAYRA